VVEQPNAGQEWLSLRELADRIGADDKRVKQLLREGRLITVRRGSKDVVPAAFVADGDLLKGLGGLVTVLHDAGFDPEESIEWMLADEDSLGTSPVRAMAEGRGKEVKRVAQALA
jgi:hypothetical protein